jgi:hypothetical protein
LVMELVLAKGSDGGFLARFANRGETHDVLQCPSGPAG